MDRIKKLTAAEAVMALDAITHTDSEEAHSKADEILRATVPVAVRQAYERVQERADFWACA